MLPPPFLPQSNYYIGTFGDVRLQEAGALMVERIVTQQTICLRQLGQDRAGEVRFGRFLDNPRVELQALEEGVCLGVMDRVTQRRCAGHPGYHGMELSGSYATQQGLWNRRQR